MTNNSKPILPEIWNLSVYDNNGELEPWDRYIMDEDIVRLLGMMYTPKPDFRFAQEIDGNPYLKYYFTPPFCFHARELGYAAPVDAVDEDGSDNHE